ncbi:MAG: GntR family transcriptional regulator [Caldicoprobacterales bacterium]|mgnify:FL=1|jgi:GntR family transcriptional regulator|nr:GntR family transcriptional regulator [Clostridiales bacterium]
MPWDLTSDRPIYAQIIEQMELKICSGVYPLGSKLPSVRDLAREASVNPNTMQRALSKLEESGLLYSVRTSGRYVTEDVNMIKETKKRIAREHIEEFLKRMSDLGFDQQDILSMLNDMSKELKK